MSKDGFSDSVLLSTKLKMPAPRKDYIVRSKIFESLRQCKDMQIIYVKGAAGTGKTTLLSSFIKETGLKNTAWLSLDESNNNVFSFWHYFMAAIANFLGDEREDILSLLRSNFETSQIERMLTLIINRICGDEDYYIVLDDMHYIKDKTLVDTLEYFLKSMPDNLHIFMLSREDPALYLGEFAVSGKFLFIDGKQLCFSNEEGRQFLRKTLKLTVSDQKIEKMNNFAEGWIGGLQLVAAAGGADMFFLHSAGSTIAADYLSREIFKSLTAKERQFLTVTGILSYFDADICGHILNDIDFDAMVQGLISKNLFITCIDEENGIYRYHNILGEYLKQQFSRLPKDEQVKYRKSASLALEARGDKEEALCHLLIAEDYAGAIRILKSMNETVETWSCIDRLPLEYLASDINLFVQCLMYNLGIMNFDRCREICDAIEERYKGSELLSALQLVKVYASGKIDSAINAGFKNVMTSKQIEDLNLSPVTQSILLVESANCLVQNGCYEKVARLADHAMQAGGGINICVDFYTLSVKAQLAEEMGRLNDSLEVYKRMNSVFKSSIIIDVLGLNYYIGLIGVYNKRMEAQNAKKALENTKQIIDRAHVPPAVLGFGYEYNLAEYEFLFGSKKKTADIADKLMQNCISAGILQMDRLFTELASQNMLKPEIAERVISEYRKFGGKNAAITSQLLYARLMMDKGENDEALSILQSVLAFSRENKNRLHLVEADLLKIKMLVSSGNDKKRTISNMLREAVYYAWENHIMQPFFLERGVLKPLIRELLKTASNGLSDGERQFLQDVLKICAEDGQQDTHSAISARELDVLRELANGLTNKEIGDRLCISISTVKTHVISIYGKLGVSSRLAAVETAKRLGLIEVN